MVEPARRESHFPLAPVVYHVLLSLGDGEKHGYAVMKEVAARTDGRERILPGTLYSTIKRLLALGWVEKSPARRISGEADPRRRYYRLTPSGRDVAAAETHRLAQLLRIARRKGFALGG